MSGVWAWRPCSWARKVLFWARSNITILCVSPCKPSNYLSIPNQRRNMHHRTSNKTRMIILHPRSRPLILPSHHHHHHKNHNEILLLHLREPWSNYWPYGIPWSNLQQRIWSPNTMYRPLVVQPARISPLLEEEYVPNHSRREPPPHSLRNHNHADEALL